MTTDAWRAFAAGALMLMAATVAPRAEDAQGRKIGLALSGGGARGAAHVGVLAVLEELGIQVDYVAGTSMGAIVGGLYCSGLSPEEIEEAIGRIDWVDAFTDRPRRENRSFRRKLADESFVVGPKLGFNGGEIQVPLGAKQGQKLGLLLREHLQHVALVSDFDELPIPFRAVAADIVTGERVLLDSGSLPTAIRASMSLPGIFAPVELDGRLLVDGGIASNLPIDVVREMGAEVVIAVDISTRAVAREDLDSALAIVSQLNSLLILRDTERQIRGLRETDVLISPELGDVTNASFDRLAEAVAVGQAAARLQAGELDRFAARGGPSARLVEARAGRPALPVIDFVRAVTDTRLDRRMLESRIRQEPGRPLDLDQLLRDLEAIYGLDVFEVVTYRVVEEGGRTGLLVTGKRRSWGPNYLQFGFGLSAGFDGSNSWNLGVAYTLAELNAWNGEWRNELQVGESSRFVSDFHQPLDWKSRWFVNPSLRWEREKFTLRENGDAKADYTVKSAQAGLSLGRELGTWGELRVGAARSWNSFDTLVGDRSAPVDEPDGGTAFFRFAWDELDDLDFPTRGVKGSLEYTVSREALGAESDQEFDQWSASLVVARSWGSNTLLGGLDFERTSSGTLPLQDFVDLGGFLRLSGLDDSELRGQHRGLARLIYLRSLQERRWFGTHVGLSIEAGQVWQDAADIGEDLILGGSVFFGVDSPVGPVYLGVGHAEGGHTSAYFLLGRVF